VASNVGHLRMFKSDLHKSLSPPDVNSKISKIELLCSVLIAEFKVKQEDIDSATKLSSENGISLSILLVRLGLVSDRDIVDIQQRVFNIPKVKEDEFPAVPLLENKLSRKFLKDAYVIPLEEDETNIVIAMADPNDEFTIQAIELACNKSVSTKIASTTQIENTLDKYFGDGQSKLADIVEEIESNDDDSSSTSIEKLKDLAGEAPIIRLVSLIINRAIELRASDIHIEPFENRLKVRYRIDGVLQEAEAPPSRSTAAVISRIKIMARMNIAEHRLPQDGRIQLRTQGKLIDLRVSTVPTMHGESLVMRILDKEHVVLDLDTLGFSKKTSEELNNILALPHGIILVTGPTGSGKTTTLYAALQILNTPERKILTVEDPVEYQLDGINQIQVKSQIGLNFSEALRSIVRQDPDIIMIGEMRDLETASIAVQSALTGHLVFSTLHTNDAGSSITRLLDMGVEDYLLTSTINGILSQRLVRMLCTHCRETYEPLPELVQELNLEKYSEGNKLKLYKPVGCDQCSNLGYVGRSVITELLTLSEDLRRLILSRADGSKLQKTAIDNGMDTMQIDGIKKAIQGITTIEEVTRVTQET
jgi:general secretion pathway protein E